MAGRPLSDPVCHGMRSLTARAAAAAAACCVAAGSAGAAETVVVTGSVVQRAVEEAPFAISVVERDTLRTAGPLINLSESMARVPGLVVNNRWNFAQDQQISSRGFGARAGFGVRGIRLYADGIPASGPDGQGQVSHFDLAGAQRIEVLRGPFSVLYGNSSGGVISLIGAPAKAAEVEAAVDVGSFGLLQGRIGVAAPLGGGFDLRASVQHMEFDGFRPHSEAERTLGNARLGWQGDNDSVTVLINALDQPALDPLGLTREQFDADPRSTAPEAIRFNTRKDTGQTQGGASWRHRFNEGALRESTLAAYAGRREVTQWLAIPPPPQANPRHGGGVVDFDRDYYGGEARLRFAWDGIDVVAGLASDRQRDQRRGFENFTGSGATEVLGVTGALRRDETNRAETDDVFVQGEWALNPGLSASAGVRSGRVKLQARDAYLSNGDDSGDRSFSYTNPVLGVRWLVQPGLNLHASFARGTESPTLGELAYRPDGSGGFNQGLDAQTSRQAEVGAKWRAGAWDADLTLFEARVSDEIGVASNAGGRSSFQNVGRTLRRGAELAGGWQPNAAWRTRLAATWLDATYRDDFKVCAGVPCFEPTLDVPAGNRIAGTQRASGWAELVWSDAVWGEWGLEARVAGDTVVNDRNSDQAAGYGIAGLRWSRTVALGSAGSRLEILARVDNLFDRAYAGSVIVNESNGRFFETGAPRSGLLALRWVNAL
jgi:iron complex outermembrane recepter protein